MVEALTVADVLERAADLIEPEGKWTQDVFSRNADGSVDEDEDGDELVATNPVCWCALGAIASAAGADPLRHDTFSSTSPSVTAVARSTLSALVGMPAGDWNDQSERTQAEVVAKLREAAALARTQVQS